jgi:hypothetical protein
MPIWALQTEGYSVLNSRTRFAFIKEETAMAVILTRKNMADALPKQRSGKNESSLTGISRAEPPEGPTPDDSIARIVKMLPGEATAAYTAALALVPNEPYVPLVAFALCGAIVVFALQQSGRRHSPPVKPETKQYVFQIAAFAAWAVAIKDPFTLLHFEVPKGVSGLAVLFIPVVGAYLMGSDPTPPVPAGATAGGESK